MSFLLLGSIFMCCLFNGCSTEKTDYVFRAEWLYINNSSVDIMVEGIEQFSFSEEVIMEIKQKDSCVISFDELGGKESVSPTAYPLPGFTEKCQITIGGNTYKVTDGIFFRNRDNYVVEKISFNNYKFIYTFTDEIITELSK